MAKIGLTEGFTLVPEGTYVFQIVKVEYKEEFGKMAITMQTQGGTKHIERFSLLKSDGSPNEGAYNAFSYFAKTALNDFSLTEIDHEDLVGCYIECDVEHDTQENKNKPGKTVTFVRLADKRPSDGWDGAEAPAPSTPATTPKEVPAPSPAPSAAPKTTGGKKPTLDLKALLG